MSYVLLVKLIEDVIKKTVYWDVIPFVLSLIEVNVINSAGEYFVNILFVWLNIHSLSNLYFCNVRVVKLAKYYDS